MVSPTSLFKKPRPGCTHSAAVSGMTLELDNFIKRINPYLVDKIGTFLSFDWTTSKFYPLDRDLSTESSCPIFVQLGPAVVLRDF